MTTKNCDVWAAYERPASSESANLCNGGEYLGTEWAPCPSRVECCSATLKNTSTGAEAPSSGHTGRRVLASTMRTSHLPQAGSGGPPTSVSEPHRPPRSLPTNGKKSFFADYRRDRDARDSRATGRTVTHASSKQPQKAGGVHRAAHAAQVPHLKSETSPVWLPDRNDGIFNRVFKNILSGAIWAFGQQLKDYAGEVDLFGTTARQQLTRMGTPVELAPASAPKAVGE